MEIVISARTSDGFKRVEDAVKALPPKLSEMFNKGEDVNSTITLTREILYTEEVILPVGFELHNFNFGEYSTPSLCSKEFTETKQIMLRIEGKYNKISYALKFMNVNRERTFVGLNKI